jgi:hypothetical protein
LEAMSDYEQQRMALASILAVAGMLWMLATLL